MARKTKQSRGKVMNPTFFVFCEGKTEAAYIDVLRRHFRIPIEIVARISDSNISQPYIDRCKRERFTTSEDKTFLMFDLDVPGMLERLRKFKDATLLLSNPCVEYWFLLHYKEANTELSSAECVSRLKKLDNEYTKGKFSPSMETKLIENLPEAIKRAMKKEPYSNPSTSVYLLTNEIIQHLNWEVADNKASNNHKVAIKGKK